MVHIANEHIDIIREALADYRRWFDGDDESDAGYRESIDSALDALR